MGILSWIIFGLIAGILAKWIMPGEDGGGFIMTVILGVVGALVGGILAPSLVWGELMGLILVALSWRLSVHWSCYLSTVN